MPASITVSEVKQRCDTVQRNRVGTNDRAVVLPDAFGRPGVEVMPAYRSSTDATTAPNDTTDQGKHDALDEQLLHDPAATCAERKPDRDFSLRRPDARISSRPGEIHTGDQHHHAHGAKQNQHRTPAWRDRSSLRPAVGLPTQRWRPSAPSAAVRISASEMVSAIRSTSLRVWRPHARARAPGANGLAASVNLLGVVRDDWRHRHWSPDVGLAGLTAEAVRQARR